MRQEKIVDTKLAPRFHATILAYEPLEGYTKSYTIQKVRGRANLLNREAEFSAYSKTQMQDQRSHERVMELAIEGTRIYDVIRWGWLYDPTKLAMLHSHDVEFKRYFSGKEFLKIPQRELDLNANLNPNSAKFYTALPIAER